MGKTRRSRWVQDEPDAPEVDAASRVRDAEHCAGKVGYPTRAKAVRAKKACGRRFGKKFKVYRCATCGEWHLSSHR